MSSRNLLIFENNLMWSVRLKKSAAALGWEATVLQQSTEDIPEAEAAIINLGVPEFAEMVAPLREKGIHVIGHAGHKERPLLQFGRDSGCDQVVTNSSLTHHLDKVLEAVAKKAGTD